jgi:hypothetical protein
MKQERIGYSKAMRMLRNELDMADRLDDTKEIDDEV